MASISGIFRRSRGRAALRVLAGVLILLVVLAGAGLGWRAWRQHEIAASWAITAPNGVEEARFVEIDGQRQWITIRGQDRDNPVLMLIDGGPGSATSVFGPSAYEADFVVVQWDQPGAGKTFGAAGGLDPAMAIEDVARIGTGVAEHVRDHLGKRKVALLASSWGTVIGVHMAKQRPDLFYAYIGTGQSVFMPEAEAINYESVLSKARGRGDAAAVAALEAIGAPPYASDAEFRTHRQWAAAYEAGSPSSAGILSSLIYAPNYSVMDTVNWSRAFLASQDHFLGRTMDGPGMHMDLHALGPDFAMPVFIFQGAEDDYTPFVLARAWFDEIRAPEKALLAAEGGGHYAAFSHAAEFQRLLRERVRPLGLAAEDAS